MIRDRFRRSLGLLLLSGLVLVLAGCGTAKSKVSGSVKVSGVVVPEGVVTFIDPQGTTLTSFIGPDGTYTIEGVGNGENVVVVQPTKAGAGDVAVAKGIKEQTKQTISPAAIGAAPKGPAIPEKYQSPTTSDLRCPVDKKDVVYDIDMK